jgi:natural product precursor
MLAKFKNFSKMSSTEMKNVKGGIIKLGAGCKARCDGVDGIYFSWGRSCSKDDDPFQLGVCGNDPIISCYCM